MASPTLFTWSQSSWFSARYSEMAAIHEDTTAWGPRCELVARWCSFVETVVPSNQTPPIFDIVAPQSVPMKTCVFVVVMPRSLCHPDGVQAARRGLFSRADGQG